LSPQPIEVLLRTNLAQTLFLDIPASSGQKVMVYTIENREIAEFERSKLLIADVPWDKTFDSYVDYKMGGTTQVFTVDLGDDLVVGALKRHEVDTGFGSLVEVRFPKKAVLDILSLAPRRFAHVTTTSITTVPLFTMNDVADVPSERPVVGPESTQSVVSTAASVTTEPAITSVTAATATDTDDTSSGSQD